MNVSEMSDRELNGLIREASAELIKRAQERRAKEQLRMEVATA